MKKKNQKKGKQKPNQKNGPIVKLETGFITLPTPIEEALISGNLIGLTPEERIRLNFEVCRTLHLNPRTHPFCYILIKGWKEDDPEKLILYATRNCTDQLRAMYGASDVPGSLKREETNDELIAEIAIVGRNGRICTDVGVIPKEGMKGKRLANARMHVVTKARRRATLALYGLGGVVDESELDTMQVVGGVTKEGRIWRYVNQPRPDRELIEYGDYPKGSPKSDLAAASLARVEAADKEFASGVADTPRAATAPASKPTQSTPAERGRVGETPRASAQGATAGGPSPTASRSQNTARSTNAAAQPAAGERREVSSYTPTRPPQANAAEHPGTTSLRVPQARIPHRIEEVKKTPNGKGVEVVLDTGHRMYSFANHTMDAKGTKLHEILLNSVGKMFICTSKLEKNYMHIDRVFQIGDREWDDEGIPVLRREPATKTTREPGEEG